MKYALTVKRKIKVVNPCLAKIPPYCLPEIKPAKPNSGGLLFEDDDPIPVPEIKKKETAHEPIPPEEDALYEDPRVQHEVIGPEIEPYIDQSELEYIRDLEDLPLHRRPTDGEIYLKLINLYKKLDTPYNQLSETSRTILVELLQIIPRHRTISSWLRDVSLTLIQDSNSSLNREITYDLQRFHGEVTDRKNVIQDFVKVNCKNEGEDEYLQNTWDHLILCEQRQFRSIADFLDEISIFNLHLLIINLENAERRESFDSLSIELLEQTLSGEQKLAKKSLIDFKELIEEVFDTDWMDEGYKDYLPNHGKAEPDMLSREEIFFKILDCLHKDDKETVKNYIRQLSNEIPEPQGDFRKHIKEKLLQWVESV